MTTVVERISFQRVVFIEFEFIGFFYQLASGGALNLETDIEAFCFVDNRGRDGDVGIDIFVKLVPRFLFDIKSIGRKVVAVVERIVVLLVLGRFVLLLVVGRFVPLLVVGLDDFVRLFFDGIDVRGNRSRRRGKGTRPFLYSSSLYAEL